MKDTGQAPLHLEKCNLSSCGERLRLERVKLGLNQTEFAELGGLKRNAIVAYEKGTSSPTVAFLYTLAAHGLDPGYVVTGIRTDGSIDPMMKQVIDLYHRLPFDQQSTIFELLSHLTGEYADLSTMGRADPATLHSPRIEYKPPPEVS